MLCTGASSLLNKKYIKKGNNNNTYYGENVKNKIHKGGNKLAKQKIKHVKKTNPFLNKAQIKLLTLKATPPPLLCSFVLKNAIQGQNKANLSS